MKQEYLGQISINRLLSGDTPVRQLSASELRDLNFIRADNYVLISRLFQQKKRLTLSDLSGFPIDSLNYSFDRLEKMGVIFESPCGVWNYLE